MAQIELADSVIDRLKKHAEPLVDNYSSVITKLLDSFESRTASVPTSPSTVNIAKADDTKAAVLDIKHMPDLRFSRIRGDFGGTAFEDWNSLLRTALIAAFRKFGSFDGLRRVTRAQIKNGAHTVHGYRYIAEIGVSYQGVEANRAWEYAFSLAKYLAVNLYATIEWLEKPEAEHPGQRRAIRFHP